MRNGIVVYVPKIQVKLIFNHDRQRKSNQEAREGVVTLSSVCPTTFQLSYKPH